MADVTLPSGRELDIDLHLITRRNFTRLVDNRVTDEEACALMGNTVGMTGAEVMALSMMDWRSLYWAIVGKGMSPLADPNSASASSSA